MHYVCHLDLLRCDRLGFLFFSFSLFLFLFFVSISFFPSPLDLLPDSDHARSLLFPSPSCASCVSFYLEIFAFRRTTIRHHPSVHLSVHPPDHPPKKIPKENPNFFLFFFSPRLQHLPVPERGSIMATRPCWKEGRKEGNLQEEEGGEEGGGEEEEKRGHLDVQNTHG